MNITLQQAKKLIAQGVSYTVFPIYCAYRTIDQVEGALRDGYLTDLIIDHYEEEGYEEELDDEDDWNSGKWVSTKPECIEILVSMCECETWEEREVRLVG
jgi:hypothetical protein